ncbi:MAG: NHL repeat-containing protein, partial [Chloroflexota bacterium]|nr:NHL repeat-containing protein [Chloroflexota bacterium]
LGEVLGLLWSEHVSEIGTRWHMPSFNLILNEPIVIVLALIAGFAAHERILVRSIATWFFTALIVISLLGDVGTPGYAILTLPLVLLAGIGVSHLIERLPWGAVRRGPAILYVGAILLMAVAVVSLLGLITSGVSDDTGDWLLRFALIVIVAILPLSFAISAIGSHVNGDRLMLVLTAVLVLLSIVTVRSSVLAASERPVEPGDPLSAGTTSESIPVIIERVEKLSRDTTMSQRSSLDPTGGHGLRIAIDSTVAQPFAWYFRDYPNLTVFDPEFDPVPLDAEIIVLGGGRDARTVAPGYAGQSYAYTTPTPEAFRSPDWGGLLTGIVNPDELRRFTDFLLNRNLDVQPEERQFQLLASAPLAEKLFPATGPFAISERPGAGAGQGQFNRPRGVDVGPDGSIYVVDSRNSRVQKFAPTGEFLQAFGSDGSGPGQLARFATSGGGGPNGIAIDENGDVYVADTWNHRIQVFSADGVYLRGWGAFFDAQDDPAQAATNDSLFYGPRGLAFHDGELYVTDTGNERVQVFTPEGAFVRKWGTSGSGAGNLLEPVGIAVAADGTVLVADSHNARIARFTSDGTALDPWPVEDWAGLTFFEPYLAVGPDGSVYATSSASGTIVSFGLDGTPGATLGEGLVRQPFGIAVTADGGSLLVTDGALHAVVTVPIPPK